MTIERTIQLDYNKSEVGIFLLKVISPVQDIHQAKSLIIQHLRTELANRIENKSINEPKKMAIETDIKLIEDMPIMYYKVNELTSGFYVVQLALDAANTRVSQIIGDLASYLYRCYGDEWAYPATPTSMSFCISGVSLTGRLGCIMIHENTGSDKHQEALNELEKNTLKYSIGIQIDIKNPEGVIRRNTPFRAFISIYDNVAEAFEKKTPNTIHITTSDGPRIGIFTFAQFRETNMRTYTFKQIYRHHKLKTAWVKDTLVIYDGDASFNAIQPYLKIWADCGIKLIDILQFCPNKDFAYHEFINNKLPKLVVHFINRNKILMRRSGIEYMRDVPVGSLTFKPSKNQKPISIEVSLHSNSGYVGDVVVPVDDENPEVCNKALVWINQMITSLLLTKDTAKRKEAFDHYLPLLFGEENIEEGNNILDDWFRSCVRTKKQTDMGILNAYMNMKSRLEQEYKQLKTYMDFYDFSKCKPIPSVSMDKKMRENYYKTLHIEPECIILNKINNKNIDKISSIKPMVKFNLLTSKGILLEGKKDLYSYYNPKTNNIMLNYIKMKGEILNDKIENRR